ncbi:unnamed protein product [Cyprideis torosa]|uniref:Uncharacterized protein n=1 Tax=Cyprideis torosa TaxID=163714 RepID=A0A7R8WE06_9CRUS|nr:unnamed protein product [Cyprideis torosa]CAG0889131.1 unnamed protein product [Cyprideis torosa]
MILTLRNHQMKTEDFEFEEGTVADLKAHLESKFGSSPSTGFKIFAEGCPLSESDALSGLEGKVVEVNIPLLGGKVHGSLARAGKVRGQTPKVERQEKKKKKTGRAKRRMQYNRRFLSSVPSYDGRRRGPNSNSPYF